MGQKASRNTEIRREINLCHYNSNYFHLKLSEHSPAFLSKRQSVPVYSHSHSYSHISPLNPYLLSLKDLFPSPFYPLSITSPPLPFPNYPAKAARPSLLKSSSIPLRAFIGTGFVKNKSTPLLKASCLVFGFAAPVSAMRATGSRPCSFSKRRMCRVDSMPDMMGMEISACRCQSFWRREA